MKKDKQTSAKIFIDPVNLLIIIIASIFSAEALVTLLLSIASPSSPERYLLLDAGMLVVILFPVIYYLVFKPFTSQIRQLKRSEEALQASEEKYRSIVETTDDSIYLVDGNYRYLFMNKKHLTRMGFSGKEYVGHSFGEFHSEEETKDFIEKVDRVFKKAQSEQHSHNSERDRKCFLRTFSPVKGPNGKVVAVSVVSKKSVPN